jgi:hypothetical protein
MRATADKTEYATGWSSERNKALLQKIRLGLAPGFEKRTNDLFKTDLNRENFEKGLTKETRNDLNINVDSLRRQP